MIRSLPALLLLVAIAPAQQTPSQRVAREIRTVVSKSVGKSAAVMLVVLVNDELFLSHVEGMTPGERTPDRETLFPLGVLSRVVATAPSCA